MGDGGLPVRAVDLGVQVTEAAGGRVGESQQRLRVQRGQLQVVVQRAVLVVVGDEEELREGAGAFDVGRDEAEDVLVSHQDSLVDLRLSEPAGFLSGEEDFDGDLLSPPASEPHLAVATLPDLTDHLDLLGDGPLHQQGEA